jgi:hypothetical protein
VATIELTAAPSGEDLDVILKGLTAYNEAEVGPADRIPLAVLIRDDDG